jgi:glutaredoxin-like protein NrdH
MNVTVYTKPDCPPCNATKQYLTRDGIEFTEVDLTNNEDAYNLVTSLGHKYTPVVVSGSTHWSGFRPDKIASLKILK